MPDLILFTQPNCQKCDWVKERIPDGLDVKIMDLKSPEGMAEAAFYELIGKPTPILIVDEEEVVLGAAKIKKRLEEIAGS